jgi:DNA-binding NarL/FixJ family response regulator
MRAHMGGNGTPGQIISLDLWASHRAAGESSPAIRVLLADGAGLVRAGLRALLEGDADITVVAEAAHGEAAVSAAIEQRPDVVLLDVGLPGMDGLRATRQILAAPGLSHVKVLILSEDASDEDLFGALRAGATGFLVKDIEPAELLRAVRVLAGGGAQLSPGVTRRLLQEFASSPGPRRPVPEQLEELTAREREVMTLVALGLTNDEIAERLVVSPATAKTHVSRAMVKLHARDRAKIVALAYETGFVRPSQHQAEPEFVRPSHRAPRVGLRSRHPAKKIGSADRPHAATGDVRIRALQGVGASVALARRVEHPV